MARVEWTGQEHVKRRMREYGVAVKQTTWRIAEYWAPVLESYAKENRPWTDRTGNARAMLWARPVRLSDDAVAIILSHGVDYGLWLEIRWQGRYAIIWPTLQAHLSQIERMYQGIFGRA